MRRRIRPSSTKDTQPEEQTVGHGKGHAREKGEGTAKQKERMARVREGLREARARKVMARGAILLPIQVRQFRREGAQCRSAWHGPENVKGASKCVDGVDEGDADGVGAENSLNFGDLSFCAVEGFGEVCAGQAGVNIPEDLPPGLTDLEIPRP